MLRDARLVASKDLRIELRSRVLVNQVVPFAVLVLVLFAFALDPDRGVLRRATPGLYWITVLFSALLALSRSASIDSAEGVRDAMRLSGLDPSGVFIGRVISVSVQLLILEVVLGVGVALLYGASLATWWLLVPTCLVATIAIAAAGTLYGVVAAGLRVRETLLPLLLLPVLAPILIGTTRATEAALDGVPSDGWPWIGSMSAFTVLYLVAGIVAYGPLMEDA